MPNSPKNPEKSNNIRYLIIFCLALIAPIQAGFADIAKLETSAQADKKGQIVVTLKPLYSLVAHITKGISTPKLLIEKLPAGHHYSLRPSQRRQLADADIIIWFGSPMEPYLKKIITQESEQFEQKTLAISAMQAPDLTILKKRSRTTEQHAAHHDEAQHQEAHSPDYHKIDPHIWLSTSNAIAISEHIAQTLIANDPENADTYRKNLGHLIKLIKATDIEIRQTLENVAAISERPFIAYHDAFQYFEKEYQLNHVATVTYEEGAGPGLKHMKNITDQITSQGIECLVYQQPKPALIDALVSQTSITAVALDPVGANTNDTEKAWFELMLNLARGFENCLKTSL